MLMTVGLLMFEYITTGKMWLLVLFVPTFALGWGSNVTTRVSLQREFFGRASFGTILGFLSGIRMIGHVAGAPLAGWIFDQWGSYQGAWLLYSISSALGAVAVFTIPSPRDMARQPAALRTE